MTMFKKYNKIPQLRELINDLTDRFQFIGKDQNNKAIFDRNIKLPVFKCQGTIKIDGTNIGIFKNNNNLQIQSKNQIIKDVDHYNISWFVNNHLLDFNYIFDLIYKQYGYNSGYNYYVFGEYFGKNISGNNTAISDLDRKFYIFDGYITNECGKIINYFSDNFISLLHGQDIFNSYMFPNYEITLDLNNPLIAIEEINSILNNIEHECPVGKYFNKIGDCEGIVWNFYTNLNERYQFKTKTPKFSVVKHTKNKKPVSIDPEIINSINDFLNYALTENRLKQGLQEICQNKSIKSKDILPFINWITNDIWSEEIQTITKNNLPKKELNSEIANIARNYILKFI